MIKQSKNRLSLRFRRWIRKNYAVFQSLGKVVTIGALRKSAIEMSMAKESGCNSSTSCITSPYGYKDSDEIDDGITDDICLSLILENLEKLLLLKRTVRFVSAHSYEEGRESVNSFSFTVLSGNIIITAYKRGLSICTIHVGSPLFLIKSI